MQEHTKAYGKTDSVPYATNHQNRPRTQQTSLITISLCPSLTMAMNSNSLDGNLDQFICCSTGCQLQFCLLIQGNCNESHMTAAACWTVHENHPEHIHQIARWPCGSHCWFTNL